MRPATVLPLSLLFLSFLLPGPARAVERWITVGPPGGDVRSLALDPSDPKRIYLGTADGVLYRSDVGGRVWQRLEPGFPIPGQSLDKIVVTPAGTLLVGFWDVLGNGGGVAISADQGLTFVIATGLEGESVRSLTLAPSDPQIVVAGALGGVFSSSDGGRSWRRISPAGHPEIRNVESLAVDPRNPRVIYAGTWHLPWKTTDGGVTWTSPHLGMIDDSDVFTMTLDRRDPRRVFATACSGIYRSPDGAAHWTRVRGIPDSSRRTRAFAQDPARLNSFYAGTTEGLWISNDDTVTWRVATANNVVVNALVVLPDGTVMLGAEGAGVLRSADRGLTWTSSNVGFSERSVARIAFDSPGRRVVVSVRGDRQHGGILAAPASRGPWTRLGVGLEGREVLSVAVRAGFVLAGTDDGLFLLGRSDGAWKRLTLGRDGEDKHPRVVEVAALPGGVFLAATSERVFRSGDGGQSFQRILPEIQGSVRALTASADEPPVALIATHSGLWLSVDSGLTWRAGQGPKDAKVNAVAFLSGDPRLILVASTRGFFSSPGLGQSWTGDAWGLPRSDLTGLAAHPNGRTAYVCDFQWGGIYRTEDRGLTWSRVVSAGLLTDRVWIIALDPSSPDELLAAPIAGGLHLLPGR